MDARSRNTLRLVGNDGRMPRRAFEDDEWVHAVLVGSSRQDNKPLFVLTDRRFLNLPVSLFRAWPVRTERRLTDVAGAELRPHKHLRAVVVRFRDGQECSLTVDRLQNPEQFLAAVDELLRRGGQWPADQAAPPDPISFTNILGREHP